MDSAGPLTSALISVASHLFNNSTAVVYGLIKVRHLLNLFTRNYQLTVREWIMYSFSCIEHIEHCLWDLGIIFEYSYVIYYLLYAYVLDLKGVGKNDTFDHNWHFEGNPFEIWGVWGGGVHVHVCMYHVLLISIWIVYHFLPRDPSSTIPESGKPGNFPDTPRPPPDTPQQLVYFTKVLL